MKNLLTLLLFTATVSFISSCGLKKTPLAEEYQVYAGKWVSNDGTWVHIYNNGGGDVKEGGTSINGGNVVFEEESMKIGLFGISKTYKIDQAPYEENGSWKMKLNGFIYVKE